MHTAYSYSLICIKFWARRGSFITLFFFSYLSVRITVQPSIWIRYSVTENDHCHSNNVIIWNCVINIYMHISCTNNSREQQQKMLQINNSNFCDKRVPELKTIYFSHHRKRVKMCCAVLLSRIRDFGNERPCRHLLEWLRKVIINIIHDTDFRAKIWIQTVQTLPHTKECHLLISDIGFTNISKSRW